MKLLILFTCVEHRIPPRCRKPRPVSLDAHVELEIREVTAEQAPVAIRVSLSRSALAPIRPHPPLYQQVTLEQVEEASRMVAEGGFPAPPMYEILCVQSGALGGARPKASMLINGRQVIAKFQQPQQDTVSVPRLEAACLALAKRAGIDAAEASVARGLGEELDRLSTPTGERARVLRHLCEETK